MSKVDDIILQTLTEKIEQQALQIQALQDECRQYRSASIEHLINPLRGQLAFMVYAGADFAELEAWLYKRLGDSARRVLNYIYPIDQLPLPAEVREPIRELFARGYPGGNRSSD